MWYLCYFLHRLLEFRLAELQSLATLFGSSEEEKKIQWRLAPHHHPDSPFYFINVASEEMACKIADRSLLIKGIFEIWGEGATFEEMRRAVEDYPEERKAPYLAENTTFKIVIDGFGKIFSLEEQAEHIENLSFIPFKGKVNLRSPEHKFWMIESENQESNNGLPPIACKTMLFGREVRVSDRKFLMKYGLSKRRFIGPTAMDPEMAFLMANQALIKPGKIAFDPFVGTGSILVAAAHFGATTMGADIDIRVIREGRGPNCNVWSNFQQYNLPEPIGLIRADNNLRPWRSSLKEIFDAIICDPPYGVRAGGRKSGGRKLLRGSIPAYIIPDEKRGDHIPSTAPYSLAECVHDLFDMAAVLLVMGGRLVFFFPVASEERRVRESFPTHKCFTLIASSEQILSSRYSRCLLTMEKTSPYTEEVALEALEKHRDFKENHAKIIAESRENGSLHSLVFSPSKLADSVDNMSLVDDLNSVSLEQASRPKYRGKYV